MIKKMFFCFTVLYLVGTNINITTQADQPRLAVLLYHHVLPAAENKSYADNGLVLTQETFAEQMEYLYRNNYHSVTAGELRAFLYQNAPLPAKSVMITFDDGYMSNYMFAYPILKQYGFKAVIFAITGGIQTKGVVFHPDQLDMLSWMQVAASSDVFEYGSHTNALHTAVNGKTGLVSVSLDQAKADLLYSQKRLNNKRLFAYPMGQYTSQIVDMLRDSGVDLAFTTNKGYVAQNSNPLLLNRDTIFSGIDLNTFASVVSCQYEYY